MNKFFRLHCRRFLIVPRPGDISEQLSKQLGLELIGPGRSWAHMLDHSVIHAVRPGREFQRMIRDFGIRRLVS